MEKHDALTLRDVFALQVLEGYVHFATIERAKQRHRMARIETDSDAPDWRLEIAQEVYRLADAMLQVRGEVLPPPPEERRRAADAAFAQHCEEAFAREKAARAEIESKYGPLK